MASKAITYSSAEGSKYIDEVGLVPKVLTEDISSATVSLHDEIGTAYQVTALKVFKALSLELSNGAAGVRTVTVRASTSADTANGDVLGVFQINATSQLKILLDMEFVASRFITLTSTGTLTFAYIYGIEIDE